MKLLLIIVSMFVLHACSHDRSAKVEKDHGQKALGKVESVLATSLRKLTEGTKLKVSYSVCGIEPSNHIRLEIGLPLDKYVSVGQRDDVVNKGHVLKIDYHTIAKDDPRVEAEEKTYDSAEEMFKDTDVEDGELEEVYYLVFTHWQHGLAGTEQLHVLKAQKGVWKVVEAVVLGRM